MCGYIILFEERQEETAPQKKARMLVERAKEKEDARLLLANSKMAEAVLAKVGSVLIALQTMLAKNQIEMVAPLIRNPLATFRDSFAVYKTSAELIIEQGGLGDLGVNDIKVGGSLMGLEPMGFVKNSCC
jgi:hypothetical protein